MAHVIDGSVGEGGGQVLRTALSLATILRRPVEVRNIRAGRRNPGLQAQHLTVALALGQIAGARMEGAEVGSSRLLFEPREALGGEYTFEVGTAGAITLVLHAILWPLAFADLPSTVTVTGGSHVPWSPPFDHLQDVFLPTVTAMGFQGEVALHRWGFYPKGGGRATIRVSPVRHLKPLALEHRGDLHRIEIRSAVANLGHAIADRQLRRAEERLRDTGTELAGRIVEAPAFGQGTSLALLAEFAVARAGFSALGERGKPAERVADEAADALLAFLGGEGAADPHLADQLVLPMVLAEGRSTLTTTRLTRHLLTNCWIVERLLGTAVEIQGEEGGPGRVTIVGKGLG